MIRKILFAFTALAAGGSPVLAFDASKFNSPTDNTPQVDRLVVQSLGSTGQLGASTPTVAGLRVMPIYGWSAGAVVQVGGSLAAGDGAGGPYVWSSTSTAADDGCLAVRPSAISAGAAGRWLRSASAPLNARCFGAKLDGTSDDTAAFSAARAAAPANGTIEIPRGPFVNNTNPTLGPKRPVFWRLSGNTHGNTSNPVLAIANDTVENQFDGTKYIGRATSSTSTGPIMRIDGAVTHTDGARGPIHTLQVNSKYGRPGHPSDVIPTFPWGIVSIVDSYATSAVEVASMYAQVNKRSGSSGAFGFVSEAHDMTGKPSSIGGPLISAELDNTANGADDTNARILLDLVIARSPADKSGSTAPNEVGTVIRIGARPGEGSIKTVLRSINLTPVSESVIDTTNFVLGPQAAALKLAAGQRIAFDGRSSDGGYARTLSVNSGLLAYQSPGGVALSVDDAGNVAAAGRVTATGGIVEPSRGTPTSSRAACTTGQRAWDASYEYRCVATNTWKRAALSTW